ncbi:MAG: transcription-repair coupling factor [Halobacteriovoraceae bacterium]|nr:transcription-repair coupling factor [Halobacteriovoraceae bacterium]
MLDSIFSKIDNNLEKHNHVFLHGPSSDQLSVILNYYQDFKKQNNLIICQDNEAAEHVFSFLKDIQINASKHNLYMYYPYEDTPYNGIFQSEQDMHYNFNILFKLSHNSENLTVVTSIDAVFQKIPNKSFFKDHYLSLNVEDIISPTELAQKLYHLGYNSGSSIEEPGTFTQKGEIFDICTPGKDAFRIHFFDDLIEEISCVDFVTKRTIDNSKLNSIDIGPNTHIVRNNQFTQNLRKNLPFPRPGQREKFEFKKSIFESLSNGIIFEDYISYFPLFFDNKQTLIDYFNLDLSKLYFFNYEISMKQLELFREHLYDMYDKYFSIEDTNSLLPDPNEYYSFYEQIVFSKYKKIYHDQLKIEVELELKDEFDHFHLKLDPLSSIINSIVNPTISREVKIRSILAYIDKNFKYSGNIIFLHSNDSTKIEFKHLLESNLEEYSEIYKRVHYLKAYLPSSFFHENSKTIFISDNEIFAAKKSKTKPKLNYDLDLFAEQLSTLKIGDFVIHSDYGQGKYLGLEQIDHGTGLNDFLVIEYTLQDKIYVPVYKIDQIQKQADSSANLQLDNLRTKSFEVTKAKAKKSVKKLAFDLLKLQAERSSIQSFPYSPPDENFHQFELDFPYEETPDQKNASLRVIEEMQKTTPMDFLVCGDVGFGKTEIAMRAAFKAVLDHKQVAILVPTTILALQHFNSFIKRFKNFPVNIQFVSRLKTPKQVQAILSDLEEGKVDILIGTHKILSKSVVFKDLGLVIVDEEQRFGVSHKEKLKLLKTSVDFLTLTATPIPRTMQMAFLGLRELALIKTAPPRRQSIKTYLIKEDEVTLKMAIEKELNRGGQVYFVHNRVRDMEIIKEKILKLAPKANILIAHGQLPERELEKRMTAFYNGDFNVLLATTIIESGIDIPSANTMIIDRADTYGLSQLHQLRGRIGRSDKKGYAYFVIPESKIINDNAQKRLKALQTFSELGSGFNIASSDLEIRGAGDILGAEQSGHIANIGLELYMELLKEAIHNLKGEKQYLKSNIEIFAPFSGLIPGHYISQQSERLRFYKRMSNTSSLEKLSDIIEEMKDIYGPFTQEVENLSVLIQIKILFQDKAITQVKAVGNTLKLKFNEGKLAANLEFRNKLVENLFNHPNKFSFSPDYTVSYRHHAQLSPEEMLNAAKYIAQQIIPC